MTHPTKRELFRICQGVVSLDVMDVDGLAADNAAATVGMENRFNPDGGFTDAFINHWFSSIQSILAEGDGVTETARAFFDGHNVAY